MTDRNRLSRRWILIVALFAVPLLGWNALQKSTPNGTGTDSWTSETEVLQPAPKSLDGKTERGQELFMGNVHFENGGPPCMGCHSIGNNGLLGGGALGPNLTNIATTRSPSELAAILSNTGTVPVPVMQTIYAEHPLTADEQVNLLAFMQASVGQPETDREWLVFGISLVGFLAAVGLIELVYHRRLRGVRKPMVREALFKRS